MNYSFNKRLKKGKYKILFKMILGKVLLSIFLTGSYLFYQQHKILIMELAELKSRNIQGKY